MPPKKLKLVTEGTDSVKKQIRTTGIHTIDEEQTCTPQEFDMLKNFSNVNGIIKPTVAKSKLNFGNLKLKVEKKVEELDSRKLSKKRPLKTVVDIETMKCELKQLEDPPVTVEEKLLCANRLGLDFFDVPCEMLARNLLGKILVRKLENGIVLKGKIVETESYLGGEDKASQTYLNKITPRVIPLYMPPGTIYIYLTYGMYHCFNISARGDGSGVLVRALAPIEGTEQMEIFRNSVHVSSKKKEGTFTNDVSSKTFKRHELCSGPSKFCIAFGLNRDHTKYSVCTWRGLWIEDSTEKDDIKIVQCPRIGIDSAGPKWAKEPLRFYILGDRSVSRINKEAEAALNK